MDQLAKGGGQAVADFAQRVRTPHLTKEHRHEMIPTTEPLGRSACGMLPHRARKVRAIDRGEHLRKATGDDSHNSPSSLWVALRRNALNER